MRWIPSQVTAKTVSDDDNLLLLLLECRSKKGRRKLLTQSCKILIFFIIPYFWTCSTSTNSFSSSTSTCTPTSCENIMNYKISTTINLRPWSTWSARKSVSNYNKLNSRSIWVKPDACTGTLEKTCQTKLDDIFWTTIFTFHNLYTGWFFSLVPP